MAQPSPLKVINSVAPIRICDNGGWTDTWFAGQGRIFNIGVYPYAEVQLAVYPRPDFVESPSNGHAERSEIVGDGSGCHAERSEASQNKSGEILRPGNSTGVQNDNKAMRDEGESRVVINAENYGERYILVPEKHWDKHPLLEAAIEYMRIPRNLSFEVTIYSEAPSGASTGTSAAVTVALIGALDQLTPGRLTPHEVALAAHRIETELLGQQSGIQDQLCSAYGGINYIDMYQYPHASVSQITVPNATWWELERRLALVYLGKSHHSSQVHEMVIRSLENAGPDCPQLEDLRQTAPRSRDALYAGDFNALGQAMIDNTAAQGRLHPALISPEAQRVIDIARESGAVGWKVNGAGGEGGSVTLLCGGQSSAKRAMLREIEQENPLFKSIPIYLSRYGLRVWQQDTV